MKKISDYKEFFKEQGYDRLNNPKRLPISELLPTGVSWSFDRKKVTLNFSNGVIVHLLRDMSGIAVVELEDEVADRPPQAYIVNADGSIRFMLTPPIWAQNGKFGDVYYVHDDLCFFFFANNQDYRMIVDPETGNVKEVIMSK